MNHYTKTILRSLTPPCLQALLAMLLAIPFVALFAVVVTICTLQPASAQPRNIDILDSLARRACATLTDSVRASLQKNFPNIPPPSADTLAFTVARHEGTWLVEQYLVPQLKPLITQRFRATDSMRASPHKLLSVQMVDCSIRYFSHQSSDDSLAREASIFLRSTLESTSGIITALPNVSFVQRDTVSRQTLARLENKQYGFANGGVPERKKSFWEAVLEPAIVVFAAAITIVLLFTIRTQ